MMERNKLWRKRQQWRVFKKRMQFRAAVNSQIFNGNESITMNYHWFELAKLPWARVYKTTGTPCSCWLCRGESYDRLREKREWKRLLKEENE